MRVLKIIKNSSYLIIGYLYFLTSGKNLEFSYQAMINLFCQTKGRSNALIQRLYNLLNPFKINLNVQSSYFPSDNIDEIVTQLNRKGFYILETLLPENFIDQFSNYVTSVPAKIRIVDNEIKIDHREIFDLNNVKGVRYEYFKNELISEKFIQQLAYDKFFLEVAGRYLGSPPILDLVEMWWHARFKDIPDLNAAQLYHFDMDRVKWLKVFIYLTDVTGENGPHCFVESSHLIDGIPENILKNGYARTTDAQVESSFAKDKIHRFIAPRGTIIFEDSSGLHKGEVVQKGARLIFELQYSLSNFGSPKAVGLNLKT
jgi:hypothetical protein